jgi:hypothetical protein
LCSGVVCSACIEAAVVPGQHKPRGWAWEGHRPGSPISRRGCCVSARPPHTAGSQAGAHSPSWQPAAGRPPGRVLQLREVQTRLAAAGDVVLQQHALRVEMSLAVAQHAPHHMHLLLAGLARGLQLHLLACGAAEQARRGLAPRAGQQPGAAGAPCAGLRDPRERRRASAGQGRRCSGNAAYPPPPAAAPPGPPAAALTQPLPLAAAAAAAAAHCGAAAPGGGGRPRRSAVCASPAPPPGPRAAPP